MTRRQAISRIGNLGPRLLRAFGTLGLSLLVGLALSLFSAPAFAAVALSNAASLPNLSFPDSTGPASFNQASLDRGSHDLNKVEAIKINAAGVDVGDVLAELAVKLVDAAATDSMANGTAAGSSATPGRSSENAPNGAREFNKLSFAEALLSQSVPSTGSSASSGGASGISAAYAKAAVRFQVDPLMGRLVQRTFLFAPDPPPGGLLRPPMNLI
jgi:hypothetical protein